METIKLLAGFGETLRGRMLMMDLRNHSVTKLRIRRLPGCPDCGKL
jgi:hypothetical protein